MGKAENSTPPEQNIHAAVSPGDCVKMGKRNGWTLKEARPTSGPILRFLCIFKGKQTSFEDTTYD